MRRIAGDAVIFRTSNPPFCKIQKKKREKKVNTLAILAIGIYFDTHG